MFLEEPLLIVEFSKQFKLQLLQKDWQLLFTLEFTCVETNLQSLLLL